MVFRFAAVIFAGMLLTLGAAGQALDEYQVKAAFLYNFAKFVEWPPEAFKTPRDPILVCVLGHNPFGNALEEAIRGKSIAGRTFAYRHVLDAESASACQILFVGSEESKHFRALLESLKPMGILTVGEAQGFAADGGVINFRLDDGRVHFEINVDAAEHEQLHISAKLLSLAQIVKSEKLP
jgi:YfiR/HmsC-like